MTSKDDDAIDLYSQNPDLVKRLSERGASLVILDLPIGSEFGIDMQHWNIGEKFRGVKMIPVGVHFIYFSCVNQGAVAPRTGFFHNFSEKEMLAYKWNPKDEMLAKIVDEDELERLVINKHDLDRLMGPFPYETYRHWLSLTEKLTVEGVHRVQPDAGFIYSVQQFIPQKYPPEAGELTTTKNGLPLLKKEPRSALRLTPIPRKRHPDGASPAEISQCGMDGSYALQAMLETVVPDDLLGELQFAFIVFLCGQQFEGFECWKKLVHVICSAASAMAESRLEPFFLSFISILHFQLKEVPKDFFLDIVSRENFLTVTLSKFFQNISDSAPLNSSLRKQAERFRLHLTRYFKWDFDQEPDDELPQVVDLN